MTAPRIAWLGVGHLAEYCVPALVTRFGAAAITLSSRGAASAARLAASQGVAIAVDNASLVAGADLVIVAPRPADAAVAVAGLPWRPGQVLVSFCAGLPLAALAGATGQARLARAMPVLAARWGESPVVLHPADPLAEEVLSALGPVITLAEEDDFEIASVAGVFFSSLMRQIAELAAWTEQAGLPAEQARLLVAQTFRAAGTLAREDLEQGLVEIVESLSSPGTFSKVCMDQLAAADGFGLWRQACDEILRRLRAASPDPR